MIPFSPGVLVGSFELMRLIGLSAVRVQEIPHAYARLGGVPVDDVLASVQGLNWMRADASGVAELTAAGIQVVKAASYEMQLRAAFLHYIDVVRPLWLQTASQGRMRVRMFAGTTIAQVIDEAGLTTGDSPDVVEFWDALAARARGLQVDRLTEIGREGERLTMEHERKRTQRDPKWIALDNNADGYDVLSVVDVDDPRRLSIEVKTTTMSEGGVFHITANEWRRAIATEMHAFHLWKIRKDSALLKVITVDQMAQHMPSDQGEGLWESVAVPFSAFG